MMDGTAVILARLLGDADLLALVPADQIIGDELPAGIALDAISVTHVSGADREVLAPGATRHVEDRVQVSVAAATQPRKKAILRAVKTACADFVGSIAGLTNVTVRTAGTGPDFFDQQASIRFGSQDFIVGYTETR
jgi:hypothetical protein